MPYIDTSIIIVALDPSDHRNREAIKILDEERNKIISELVIIELANVLSRRRELVSQLASKLGLSEELTIFAILLYIMKRFKLRYESIEKRIKSTILGKMYSPVAAAIELSKPLQLKTLDSLHIGYIKVLKDEGKSIDRLITADTDFEKAKEYLDKVIGIALSTIK